MAEHEKSACSSARLFKRLHLSLSIDPLSLLVQVISVFVAVYFGMKSIVRPEITKVSQQINSVTGEVLRSRIIQRIEQARAYALAGGPYGRENALRLFREAVAELTPAMRASLDTHLLAEAEEDFKNQYYDDALRKYLSVFSQSDFMPIVK